MALVKYKIKNITDHDVKTISFSSYEDQYAEKPVKGFSNILQHYAPEYCKINSIGYDSGYLNSGEEIIFTIDVPTKRSEPIKSIKIDNISFRL
jgi:hypothetical protein